jgi:hypothetical protein
MYRFLIATLLLVASLSAQAQGIYYTTTDKIRQTEKNQFVSGEDKEVLRSKKSEGSLLGAWNPKTNTPALTSNATSVTAGGYYVVTDTVSSPTSFTGVNFSTATVWKTGDQIWRTVSGKWMRQEFKLNPGTVTKAALATGSVGVDKLDDQLTQDILLRPVAAARAAQLAAAGVATTTTVTPGLKAHSAVVALHPGYDGGKKWYVTQAKVLTQRLVDQVGIYIGDASVQGGAGTGFSGDLLVRVFVNGQLVDSLTAGADALNAKVPFTSLASAELRLNLRRPLLLESGDTFTVAFEHTGPERLALFYSNSPITADQEYGINMHIDGNSPYVASLTTTPTFFTSNPNWYLPVNTYSLATVNAYLEKLPALAGAVDALSLADPAALATFPVVASGADIVYQPGATYAQRGLGMFLKGKTRKAFNVITLPLVRNLVDNVSFTGGITVKVFLRNDVAITKVIPFSELAYYNTLGRTDPAEKFDYNLVLDAPLVINPNDLLFVGWECNAVNDKLGIIFKGSTASEATEYSGNYVRSVSDNSSIAALAAMPALYTPQGYYLRLGLSYGVSRDNVTAKQIARSVEPIVALNPGATETFSVLRNDASVVYLPGATYAQRGLGMFLKGKTRKAFNVITLPLVRNLVDNVSFTAGITVKVFLRNDVAITKVIPFSELSYYNTLQRTDAPEKFDYNLVLDAPLVLNPNDLLFVGWECNASSDKLGIIFKGNTASDATEFSGNYVRSVSDNSSIANLTQMPALYAANGYYFRVGLSYAVPAESKQDLSLLAPPRLYAVVNDLGNKKGYNRNYSVPVYLDHFLSGLTREIDAYFDATHSDRYVVTPNIITTDGADATVYNDGLTVSTRTIPLDVAGKAIVAKRLSTQLVSTVASANKAKKPIVLVIGTSISHGTLANLNGSADVFDVYWSMAQELFRKDYVDNGSVSGQLESMFVGRLALRNRTVSYAGQSVVVKGYAEAIPGSSWADWVTSSASPFYDADKPGVKFSVVKYLSRYKTLADDGVTRLVAGSSAGSLVSDVNAFDVCRPTHIVIELDANGPDPATYVQRRNDLVASIKAEYAAQGWPAPQIAIALFDYAGTYFPSRYPQIGQAAAFWNLTHNHQAHYDCMKNAVTTPVAGADLLPFFWTQPTALAVGFRVTNMPDGQPYLAPYGWLPSIHPGGYAHANAGYQLYSWIKYTLTQ